MTSQLITGPFAGHQGAAQTSVQPRAARPVRLPVGVGLLIAASVSTALWVGGAMAVHSLLG
ncbi:hypothetical protein [Phenylobacterium sp.]|uniref:hypothetical protein n=1 Tax=Phenylobacterium sp. TaxID=1871053 RepID=UPI00122ACE02|nr:hypothetical protein [Phenylobacterium sp.]THD64992.1 MAG: hypothetical protein E8A49_00295 [Phenylobacterium sp.]